jgi:glycosyltransferase involved in cell wall biosynthesis
MIWYYPTRYSRNNMKSGKRRFMAWYYQTIPKKVMRRANAVITVSNAAKQSIVENMQINDDRIFVTHEAASSIYRPLGRHEIGDILEQKYHLYSNFILGIGSADRRKNIKALINAYALLPEPLIHDYKLVIVYNHKSLAAESFLEAEHLGVSEHILFLEEVSDQELVYLYNLASILVFPSLEEGFGLPPLEAMACGIPVLAANNSSIPEIVGDAAWLFNPMDAGELTRLMSKVITETMLQKRMEDRGIQRASTFSWRKCAIDTIDVYKKVMSSQGGM